MIITSPSGFRLGTIKKRTLSSIRFVSVSLLLSRSYASGDIFIFPSTTETFGNVVQEAISSGLPAVVSDIGGCKEIVEDSKAGFVCEANNTDEFHDAILKLIDNKAERNRLVENGLAWSRKRTWESINGRLIDTFNELIVEKDADRERP